MTTLSRRLFSSCSRVLNEQKSSLDPKKVAHMQYLLKYYSPDVVSTILKAESAIDPKHYANKKLSNVQFAPHFLTDFTKRDAYWDHVEPGTPQDFLKVNQPNTSTFPADKEVSLQPDNASPVNDLAKKLSLMSGYDEAYIKKLKVKTLILKIVRNQTSKGKIDSYYTLVCAGDGKGMLGIGEGKDLESPRKAMLKAHWQAVKNLAKVPRLEDRTVYGNIEHKYVSSVVQLRSAPPGSGLRCNPMIFELAQCAGIKDLSAKVYRSRNKMNVVKCTMEALLKQKTMDQIANERGKKVIDLRKTYYSVQK
ncbi:mitochondrial 37S ribosomal protein [Martiniozyma asiatica (nom. inval.)]|nr:mitochondrial 37S ribosomal protein [Martiniozyma asiatica]